MPLSARQVYRKQRVSPELRAAVSKLCPGPGDVMLKVDSDVSISISVPKLSVRNQVMLGSGEPLAPQPMVTLSMSKVGSSMIVLIVPGTMGVISPGMPGRTVIVVSPGDGTPGKNKPSITGAAAVSLDGMHIMCM